MKVLTTIAYELDMDCLKLYLLSGRMDELCCDRVTESRLKHPDWKQMWKVEDVDVYGYYRPDNLRYP